ncbi:coiled-coil domain-containing protein 126 [Sinocyclocheilus anshuiensis]|uniref:Coiled-coil domain-containing protein 126-like n=2 Tax=Sinocyclocheilus TaxID=75365 RepID=A0A671NXX2_9TELE|nr:PREDICTED: coiled-coil domain-containing protein 126-like [Sinocyclocheilus anshuiensis]XP_016300088.1 PREDICTED: coiled-coil domain-containing protein 126-like [Sinocyclocheilus anshuiensis]XP_016419068.1 PREDICTED: coiled-coil domain-containing protein 126-like [Sinocyclocheilus rhinocerous]XP_016419070.1 PREDICTED: coiled-coil domain-containing protein 126-like [Sinocyclocheilus rhinocerous]XP_016419071.1 PREDICTED: coiled-coil domain-containing protein 126-like [Sinocyclocheilus rhinocer
MLSCVLRRSMSHRLSVFLVVFGLAWCLLLLHYTITQPRRQSSAELRQQILELSHRYVKVLSEENQNPSGPHGTSMAGYADLKRTIAVLLDDILNRLVKLEGKVEVAVNASIQNISHPAAGAGTLLAARVTVSRSTKQNMSAHRPDRRSNPLHFLPQSPERSHKPHSLK